MQASIPDLVIGGYSDGKVTPSLYEWKGSEVKAVLSEINCSYIIKHGNFYYVVAEHQNGFVITLDLNYKVVSKVPSMGDDPCHLSVDPQGRFLVATNYSSGSFIVYKLTNGLPTHVHAFILHEGHGNDPIRQESPHPHSTAFSEDGTVLFNADLGTDIIYYYSIDQEKVTWIKQKSIKIQNSGPRTLTNGKPGSGLLYLTCQLDNTIRVLSYKTGALDQVVVYKISQNPTNYPAEIKYLNSQVYVSLRGDDKIMIFSVKGESLQMNFSFKVANFPRHFAVTSENMIFVACQKANLIQKYLVSQQKILLLSEVQIKTPSVILILDK